MGGYKKAFYPQTVPETRELELVPSGKERNGKNYFLYKLGAFPLIQKVWICDCQSERDCPQLNLLTAEPVGLCTPKKKGCSRWIVIPVL